MSVLSDDFIYFLRNHFPNAYRSVKADNVTESTITSIISRYSAKYEIYKAIPDNIKRNHGDIVPPEVLNGNVTVRDYIKQEEEKYDATQKANDELIGFSVSMLALGYTVDTVTSLTQNRAAREALLREADGEPLNAEQMARWLATRIYDIKAIRDDWQDNQPEKYALHLAKSISRAKKSMDRCTTEEERAEKTAQIKKMEKELKKVSGRLTSRASRQNMVDYLRAQPQQAALRHLEPDTLTLLTGLMKKQGIKIEAVENNKTRVRSHESLTESLKNDYARMKKSGSLLRKAIRTTQSNAERITERAMQKVKKKAKSRALQAKRYSSKQAAASK